MADEQIVIEKLRELVSSRATGELKIKLNRGNIERIFADVDLLSGVGIVRTAN